MGPEPSRLAAVLTRKRLLYGLVGLVVVVLGLLTPMFFEGSRSQDLPVQSGAEGGAPLEGPEMGGMLLRLVGGTAVVLALCVGTLWVCRRWYGVKFGNMAPGAALQIVESLTLTGPCRVDLVRAGDRYLLAGMDAAGLKTVLAVEGRGDEDDVQVDMPAQRTTTRAA